MNEVRFFTSVTYLFSGQLAICLSVQMHIASLAFTFFFNVLNPIVLRHKQTVKVPSQFVVTKDGPLFLANGHRMFPPDFLEMIFETRSAGGDTTQLSFFFFRPFLMSELARKLCHANCHRILFQ